MMTDAKRIVIKIGSSTLTDDTGGIDRDFLQELALQISALIERGVQPIIVSSGAIAAGLTSLNLPERPGDMASLQACAAVGSIALAHAYEEAFATCGITIGQVLLTRNDTSNRESYLLARNAFARLLEMGVVPIVNENDTVAIDEIRFGDNDTLAALVGTMIHADLVILLSDIDGFYDIDPRATGDRGLESHLLDEVEELTADILEAAGGSGTAAGSGGMVTKIEAARVLMKAGIPMIICDGRRSGVLLEIFDGEQVGTTFKGATVPLRSRKLWIALGGPTRGRVTIDDGAITALRTNGRSLLCAGIIDVEGEFERGDAILLRDAAGSLVGRGLTSFSSEEVSCCLGKSSEDICRIYEDLGNKPVIHRDQLVIY